MGNRATIIFADKDTTHIGPAIYLHWNGGAESVYAFLDELDRRNVRADMDYTSARFIHVVGDFFDGERSAGGLSLGVSNGPSKIDSESLESFNPGDNGVFVVTRRSSKHPLVRRFDHRGEWTAEQVASEERQARKHCYNLPQDGDKSIAEVFTELRPEITH